MKTPAQKNVETPFKPTIKALPLGIFKKIDKFASNGLTLFFFHFPIIIAARGIDSRQSFGNFDWAFTPSGPAKSYSELQMKAAKRIQSLYRKKIWQRAVERIGTFI
jgi:hypothetical protein